MKGKKNLQPWHIPTKKTNNKINTINLKTPKIKKE